MRKSATFLVVIIYLFSTSSVAFAAQESITVDGQDVTPTNNGIIFGANAVSAHVHGAQALNDTGGVSADNNTKTGTMVNFVGPSNVSGSIGEVADPIGTVAGGLTAAQVTVTGSVYATNLNITATGEIELHAASTIGTTTFTGAGILDLDATLTGNVVNTGASGNIDLAAGSNLTGTITTNADNQGTLTLSGDGNSTVSGAVGTSAVLDLTTITKSGTGTGTFSSDVFAKDTKVTGTGTIAFGGNTTTNVDFDANGTVTLAAGKTLTGTVLNSTDEFGTLTFLGTSTTGGAIGAAGGGDLLAVNANAGTLTLGHNIAALTTTMNNAAILLPNGNRTITGNLTLAGTGTLNIGTNTLTLAGTGIYTQGANTTLAVGMEGTSSGQVVGAGNAIVNAGSAVTITTTSTYIPNGTTYKVIDGAGGANVNVPTTITDNNRFITFSGTSSIGDLILTASRTNSFDKIATDSNASAAGVALDSAGEAGATGDMLGVLNTLEGLSDSEISPALDTIVPVADAGTINATTTFSNNFITLAIERVGQNVTRFVRNTNDKATSGFSAGDKENLNGVWAKGFGSYLTQDERKGIKGYDATTFGTALGIDRLFRDNITLGISGGWAYGDVDSDVNDAETDIDSAQVVAYGGYENADVPYFVNIAGAFAYNWYDGKRNITIGPSISRTANADYSGQQYSVYLGGGYDVPVSGIVNFTFTPLVSLQWSRLNVDSYTETDADSLNLSVEEQDYDILQSGVGARVAHSIKLESCTLTPEIYGKWLYDFIGDEVSMTSTFTGGGASFETKGFKPARHSGNVGTKLAVAFERDLSLIGEYGVEVKEDFLGQYGTVTVKYKF